MASRIVEVIRRLYECGSLDSGHDWSQLPFLHEEIEFVNPPDAVASGTRRGRAGVVVAQRNSMQSCSSWRYELLEVFDAGESVVAWLSSHATARTSGVNISHHEAHTSTFRDGLAVRMQWGRDLEQALRAVGIER